jgi:hypothetical protein
MTSPRPYHRTSKASRVRKLFLTTTLTPKEIAEKVHTELSYVYSIRSLMPKPKPPAFIPPATMPVLGIAGLPQADTVTVSSLSDTSTVTSRLHPAMNSYIPYPEAAHAASEVEDTVLVAKHRKQQWMTVAVVCVLLAALIVYASVK